MEHNPSIKPIIQNIILTCMVLSLSFSFPAHVFSQETTDPPKSNINTGNEGSASSANSPSTLDTNSQNRDSEQQKKEESGEAETTSNTATGGSGDVAGSLVSCSIGAILGNIAKQAISSAAGSVVGEIVTKEQVPVENVVLEKKESGASVSKLGVTSIIVPSWDAIGFCLVNAIIDYIGQATVEWINNGFEDRDGNKGPVFVNDPGEFFAKIADEQTGQFLGEISNGLLCSPFKLDVGLNIATRATRNFREQSKCTFTKVSGNIEDFLSGKTFSYEDFLSVTQNPANNPYGAEALATAELNARIVNAQGQERVLLDWGKGFLSFKDEKGKVTSPGSIIESQVNSRINNPNQRLLIADEFDEIITALVNQLLKIAINEMTKSSQ